MDLLYEFLNTYIFHWLPSNAIWVAGHTLSWDARCSGIYIGFGIGVLYYFVASRNAKELPPYPILIFISVLFLPLFIDVFSIKYGLREPSNDIRYLTGLLFGTAFSSYLYPAFTILASINERKKSSSVSSLYKFVLLIILVIGVFFVKALDTFAVYTILESLSVFGFLSLFTILILGMFNIFWGISIRKKFIYKEEQSWAKEFVSRKRQQRF